MSLTRYIAAVIWRVLRSIHTAGMRRRVAPHGAASHRNTTQRTVSQHVEADRARPGVIVGVVG